MGRERGKYLTELRRSNAASPQNRRHDLTDEEAIEEQLEDFEFVDPIYQAAEELAREFGTDISEFLP